MFTEDYRDSIRTAIIERVKADSKIVSGAVIGSYARKEVDKFSDIDLTFGFDEASDVKEILDNYRRYINEEFSGEFLFELKQGDTIYEVFILPGCLQVDLSFTPQKEFGPKKYPFELLFGFDTGEKRITPPEPIREKFGLMVHHILRSKVCLERDKLEKSKEWLNKARKYWGELNLGVSKIEYPNKDRNSASHDKGKIWKEISKMISELSEIEQENNNHQRRIIAILKELNN